MNNPLGIGRSAWLAGAAVVFAAGCGSAGRANASVYSFAPDTDFSTAPTSISFGGGLATYTFSAFPTGNGPGAAVATGGTGQVSSFLGSVTDFGAGASIDQIAELYTFSAFSPAALIPNSPADDFVGLAFTLGDGLHFGYAEVAGPTLVSYAYESTPNVGIATGAVPEPASIALLTVGIIGLVGARRRINAA